MMEERQKALQFSDQLDKLLQNRSVTDHSSNDFNDLLGVAQKLSATDFSHDSHIRQSLYARLQTAQSYSSRSAHPANVWQQKLLIVSLSTILLITVIFTVPPIRAWAQEIIKRLQTITLTNAPSLIEPYLTGTPPADMVDSNFIPENLSLAQAITQAGFTPLLPTYLPAGYVLTTRTARIGQITSDFEPTGIDRSYCCVIFSIMQMEAVTNFKPYPVGNVPITDVVVRNNPGLWVQNAEIGLNKDANGNPQIMPGNLLTWEENGYLFWMTSFDSRTNTPLSKDEMMKVANTLQMPPQ